MGGRAEESHSKEIESSQESSSSISTSLHAPAPRGRLHLQADRLSANPRKTSTPRSFHQKETRDVSHLRSERSASPGRKGKRPRSEDKTRPFQAPTKTVPPTKRYAQYGFDPTRFENKKQALNGFLMRLLNQEQGQRCSWKLTGKRVEGGGRGILVLDSFCCAKLWPNLTEKIFEGEVFSDKDDAKDSAIDKFWEDPAVKEAAATLPPSKKEQGKIAGWNQRIANLKKQRDAANQARREASAGNRYESPG